MREILRIFSVTIFACRLARKEHRLLETRLAGPTQAARHIIGLDALRMIAALLVVCYHFCFWHWTRGMPFAVGAPKEAARLAADHPWWHRHMHGGWIGVEIFFVISGFVIAWTASEATSVSFARSRFLRLAPVSWIAALTTLLLKLWLDQIPLSNLGQRFVETLVFWPFGAIDPVWWTLGIEINFYLLVYYLLRTRRFDRLERLMVWVGVASGCFWAVALAFQNGLDGAMGWKGTLRLMVLKAEGNRELQLLLVQHGCLFAFGTVIWKAWTVRLSWRRAVALCVLAMSCSLEIIGQNGIIERASGLDLSAIPALAIWTSAMALLVVSLIFDQTLRELAGGALPSIRFAGVLTYPLYLLHDAVGTAIVLVLAPSIGLAAIIAAIVVSLLVSAAVVAWTEPWLRRHLSHFWLNVGNPRWRRATLSERPIQIAPAEWRKTRGE